MTNEEISEYITFPRSFEKYRWYKPILVFIVGAIIYTILNVILVAVFSGIYGENIVNTVVNGGYEVLNTVTGQILSDLSIILIIPSLFIATKIVKDRPFSSYSSSRGGWNFKLYFKSLIIPFIFFMIFGFVETAINGSNGTYHFSLLFLIITLISVPLQCIAEEYVYRGLIMQTFGSWFKIPILAIILQSIIFALSHGYNSLGNIEIFFSGLVMGFLAWKANGIEVSSAFHTANNLSLSLLIMFGLQSTSTNVQLTDLVIAVIFDVVLCIIIYYVGKKTEWFGEIPENSQNA